MTQDNSGRVVAGESQIIILPVETVSLSGKEGKLVKGLSRLLAAMDIRVSRSILWISGCTRED